jgi:hypothetical protein
MVYGNFAESFIRSMQLLTYALAMRVSGEPVSFADVLCITVAKTKTENTAIPVDVRDDDLEAALAWWVRRDAELLAYENSPAAGEPELWPQNWDACTPYAQYSSQGHLCEFHPLCMAGGKWQSLVGMYEVKREEKEVGRDTAES